MQTICRLWKSVPITLIAGVLVAALQLLSNELGKQRRPGTAHQVAGYDYIAAANLSAAVTGEPKRYIHLFAPIKLEHIAKLG